MKKEPVKMDCIQYPYLNVMRWYDDKTKEYIWVSFTQYESKLKEFQDLIKIIVSFLDITEKIISDNAVALQEYISYPIHAEIRTTLFELEDRISKMKKELSELVKE